MLIDRKKIDIIIKDIASTFSSEKMHYNIEFPIQNKRFDLNYNIDYKQVYTE